MGHVHRKIGKQEERRRFDRTASMCGRACNDPESQSVCNDGLRRCARDMIVRIGKSSDENAEIGSFTFSENPNLPSLVVLDRCL